MSTQALKDTSISPEKLYSQLNGILNEYLDKTLIDQVYLAYQLGSKHHAGQVRKSGEVYICHPLAVAISLAQMHMDAHGIMAAILHDIIEDTDANKADIFNLFGEDVAELVDGVTKLTQLNCKTRAEAQAENVRKMCLAMAKDMRVIIIKLADRLHNMQTLSAIKPDKKRRIAKETLDIYVPIANRLGMNSMHHKLKLLCFKAIYPMRYRILNHAIKKARGNREAIISKIIKKITKALEVPSDKEHISYNIEGREKYIYSIYEKMLSKKSSLADILDVYAFRIKCDDNDTCYRILGIIHNLFKPIPGKFKDYIALPKANGYQSLHTILTSPYEGVQIEIQIRTHQMHRMSESGIATHWLYKSDEDYSSSKKRVDEWISDLSEIQKTSGNSLEFIDSLKINLFPQRIFVFTPQGNIIKLPKNASAIDFAYAIHTDIGNSCSSVYIDKHRVPLQTKLENGVTVKVITSSVAKPNLLWLNNTVTTKARSGIRSYLKYFRQQEAINLGRKLLKKELQDIGKSLNHISEIMQNKLLSANNIATMDELFEAIGLGNKMPFLIARQINQTDTNTILKLEDTKTLKATPLTIKGSEGIVITLATCCYPIPGDPIIGHFNAGKGIIVHHHECNIVVLKHKKSSNWLEVEWSHDVVGEYAAEIRLELLNKNGALATIASTISKMDSNIENIIVNDHDGHVSVDLITLTVKNRVHLANIIRQLKKLPPILKVTRTRKTK